MIFLISRGIIAPLFGETGAKPVRVRRREAHFLPFCPVAAYRGQVIGAFAEKANGSRRAESKYPAAKTSVRGRETDPEEFISGEMQE